MQGCKCDALVVSELRWAHEAYMQPRTRMFMTLSALAVAMTACALLLAWIEPKAFVSSALTDPQQIDKRASDAVDRALVRAPRPPREVRIVTAPSLSDGPTPLTATTHSAGSSPHFIVFESGDIHAASPWGQSGRGSPDNLSIIIALSGTNKAESLPPAQWFGLRALLLALRTRLEAATGESRLPITSISDRRSPAVAQSLRELLGLEGFTLSAR